VSTKAGSLPEVWKSDVGSVIRIPARKRSARLQEAFDKIEAEVETLIAENRALRADAKARRGEK